MSLFLTIHISLFLFDSFCGFGEALVFKDLTNEDIEQVETFVRNDFPKLLNAALEEHETVYTTTQKTSFFGPYAAAPEMFRFSPGDTKLLLNMVRHVKRVVDQPEENDGLEHFTNVSALDKKQANHEKQLCRSVLGLVFGQREAQLDHKALVVVQPQQSLFVKAQEIFSKYANNEIVQQRNLSVNMIQIQKEADKTKAKITCTFCKEGDLGAIVSITLRPPGTWIMSNLEKHLKKKHSNQAVKSEVNIKSSTESLENKKVEASTSGNGEQDCANANSSIESLEEAFGSMSTHIGDVTMGSGSCEDIIYDQLLIQSTKMNKAATRNEDKVLTSNFGLRQAKAKQEKGVKFCRMNSNGDCFFLAISHQLYSMKAGTEEHIQKALLLRKNVVKYIKQDEHFSNYLHDLKGRADIDRKATENDIKDACMQFLDEQLSKTGTWAGMESIKAVCEMQNVNIVVINDDGSSYLPNHLNPKAHKSLILLFGTTNKKSAKSNAERVHYDSIVAINPVKITLMAKEIDEAEGRYAKFVAETANPSSPISIS